MKKKRILQESLLPLYEINGYKIEIRHGKRQKTKNIYISGKKSIKEHTQNYTHLTVDGEEIYLYGRDLECITYTNGSLEIEGYIEKIQFGGGGE